jgi:hypothetical protein
MNVVSNRVMLISIASVMLAACEVHLDSDHDAGERTMGGRVSAGAGGGSAGNASIDRPKQPDFTTYARSGDWTGLQILGTAEPGVHVALYRGDSCDHGSELGGADANDAGKINIQIPDIRADANGFMALVTKHDKQACFAYPDFFTRILQWPSDEQPHAPVIERTDPASGSAQPELTVSTEDGADVLLFWTDDCTGTPAKVVAASRHAGQTTLQIKLDVPASTAGLLYAQARRGTELSACSDPYQYSSHQLPTVTVESIEPIAGSFYRLSVKGKASDAEFVRLYASSDCGASAADDSSTWLGRPADANGGDYTAQIAVPTGTTAVKLWAKAIGAANLQSPCTPATTTYALHLEQAATIDNVVKGANKQADLTGTLGFGITSARVFNNLGCYIGLTDATVRAATGALSNPWAASITWDSLAKDLAVKLTDDDGNEVCVDFPNRLESPLSASVPPYPVMHSNGLKRTAEIPGTDTYVLHLSREADCLHELLANPLTLPADLSRNLGTAAVYGYLETTAHLRGKCSYLFDGPWTPAQPLASNPQLLSDARTQITFSASDATGLPSGPAVPDAGYFVGVVSTDAACSIRYAVLSLPATLALTGNQEYYAYLSDPGAPDAEHGACVRLYQSGAGQGGSGGTGGVAGMPPVAGQGPAGGPAPVLCGANEENVGGVCQCISTHERNNGGSCIPKCTPPRTVRNDAGQCVCPSGTEGFNNQCLPTCKEQEYRNQQGACVCFPDSEVYNGVCTAPCGSTEIRLDDGTCGCEHTHARDPNSRECVKGNATIESPSSGVRVRDCSTTGGGPKNGVRASGEYVIPPSETLVVMLQVNVNGDVSDIYGLPPNELSAGSLCIPVTPGQNTAFLQFNIGNTSYSGDAVVWFVCGDNESIVDGACL